MESKMQLADSSRRFAVVTGLLLWLAGMPVFADGKSPDRNAMMVSEALSLPEDSITRVTRCNLGRMSGDAHSEAVDSCYLAVLRDRILFLKLKSRKPARFDTLLDMPFAEIEGLALFERTPAQIQLHYRDEIYGVDVLGNLLFRDGKGLMQVYRDLKAAGLPLVEPVEWIQTVPNPGVPFSMKIG